MSFESTSPNMNLVIPGVGLTSGPTWSSDLNTSLSLIDAHDHSAGKGVQINPAGIDINTDLPFNSNSLTSVKSIQLQSQLSLLTTIDTIYVSGVDLYYNDGNGIKIPITSGGNVNAGAGSITGLPSGTASATYISGSQTFVWQSATSTAANMDMGSIILRKITAGSAGITIAPPSSLSASYTITLPAAPPAATSFLRMNSSGAVAADVVVDGTSITISSGVMSASVPGAGTITGTQIAAHTITENNLELRPVATTATAGQIARSNSSNTFSTATTTFVDVTNLTVTLTTTGRPVFVGLMGDSTNTSRIMCDNNANANLTVTLIRDSTTIITGFVGTGSSVSSLVGVPPGALWQLDFPAAGTYVYKVQMKTNSGSNVGFVENCRLVAYEI